MYHIGDMCPLIKFESRLQSHFDAYGTLIYSTQKMKVVLQCRDSAIVQLLTRCSTWCVSEAGWSSLVLHVECQLSSCPGFPRILESHWKYLNFFLLNSRPWKYLKTGQVLESPRISFHRSLKVLEFTKSNYRYAISTTSLNNICIGLECICFTYLEICQVFCLTQDLLIIVMFCFYQLKLSRNHRNKY